MARHKKAFSGKVNDVDLRLMRVFKAVIECGGLSAAQTELGVGRSTISRQISDLETRLGLRLCHRGRSGFYLTQQGRQAIEYIDKFLISTEDFASGIASISNQMVGNLEIGMQRSGAEHRHGAEELAVNEPEPARAVAALRCSDRSLLGFDLPGKSSFMPA